MKKILLPAILILLNFTVAFSQVKTISNALNSPTQYTNLQMQIDSANNGDTIYVHPGTYGNIRLNKRLTLIGTGFNPQGQYTTTANISAVTLDKFVPTTSSTGSKFIGLNIGYINQLSTEQFQIDSILIERCRITTSSSSYVLGNYWTFRNNLFYWTGTTGNVDVNFYSYILFENNIFHAPNGSFQIKNSNKNTVFFLNNIFTGHYDNIAQFFNVSYARFENNIFFGKSPYQATNSDFAKNIFYGSVNNSINPTSNGVGNITADPQFTSMPITNDMYQFAYTNDYRLKTTSPGRNAGTDGTDIGIFGGQNPMPLNVITITGEPKIPQIYYMFLQNAVIDQNTPLNVTIKARKVN